MYPDPKELAVAYGKMGDSELLELARSYDALTESAQSVLRAEFSRRHLEPPLIEDEEASSKQVLVTISRYCDLSEAIVARSYLESAGISVYLRDENLVRLDWQISNFIGGIRLQVASGDQQAAMELLSQPIPASFEVEDDVSFSQPSCPVCNSLDVTFQGSSRGAALASLYVLSLPLPLGAKSWVCESCGARWEDEDTPAPGS